MPTARRPPPLSAPLLSLLLSVATRGGARASTDPAGVAASMAATTAASAANLAATLATTFATTAVAASDPAVSAVDEAAATSATEPGEGTSTPGTATGAATGSTPPAAPDVLPALTPPPGGLRSCDEIVADAVPADVVAALLGGVVGDIPFVDEWPAALATHDVKVRKVCASCEEANLLWKAGGGDASADEVMPYCASGKFASGRTLSGLLFEPLDRTSADPPSGKVATTIYFDPGDPDPLSAPSEAFPSDPTSNLERASALLVPLAAASAGTYVVVPDGLGRGEDWAGIEGYMVKEAYQASTAPLLLKVREMVRNEGAERGGECTELDGRINLMGYSAGGYAAVAAAEAVGALGDGYELTHVGVGGAPLALSTAQMRAVVEMDASVYPFPFFAARLGHSYSSTNPDLANTVDGSNSSVPRQDFASDEYLDPDDPTRNVRKWAEVGLSYEGMAPFLPPPPPVGKQSDLLNPSFVEMIVNSFAAGNDDPCNSEFNTNATDKLCEAIKDNDVMEILLLMDSNVTICHSPDDEVIYVSNVPNTTEYDHLTLVEDLPVVGPILAPSGSHREAALPCALSFLYPFTVPSSDVRNILPLDDPTATCLAGATATSPTSPSTAAGADVATTTASLTGSTLATPASEGVVTSSPTSSPTTESALASTGICVPTWSRVASMVAMGTCTVMAGGLW